MEQGYSDFQQQIEASELGIIYVDTNQQVLWVTPAIKRMFGLGSSDTGNLLDQIDAQLDENDLRNKVKRTLNDLAEITEIVSGRNAHTYRLHIWPCKSSGAKQPKAVIAFEDITSLQKAEKQLSKKVRQQESLAQLGLYALEKDHQAITHRGLQIICEMLPVDYCMVLKFDRFKDKMRLIDSTLKEEDMPDEQDIPTDSKWDASAAFEQKESLYIEDYDKEETCRPVPFLEGKKVTSGINVVVEGISEPYGILSAYTEAKRKFLEYDRNFIQVIANLIGESKERNRKEKKLKEEVKRSKLYQKQILDNSVIQRWNLGGYLHDNLAHILVSIKISVAGIQSQLKQAGPEVSSEIEEILEKLDEGITGIRSLTNELIPIDIKAEGVRRAYQTLLRQLQKTHNIKCKLETDDTIEKVKDRKVATNLYNIIQEAVKNAAVHGEAGTIRVKITKDGSNLKLLITDDGLGLKRTQKGDEPKGSGMNIMKHRIELIGGKFHIEEINDPDATGTKITCTLPLKYIKMD